MLQQIAWQTVLDESPPRITAQRLTLIPWSQDLVRLALDDREGLQRRLAARVLPRWAEEPQREILTRILHDLEVDPTSCVWRFYLIMHAADQAIIGDAGFKGPPDSDGTVEIAYGVLPAYRRQGYAFEAARALVDWAFRQPHVKRIVARCDDDNAGSIRILEKLGMRRTATDDHVLLWQLDRTSHQG